METHGLPPRPTDGDQPPPLDDQPPALRVELRARTVTAINGDLVALIGRGAEEILGCALMDLWAPQERAAIESRFDDAVLLGHDVISALALDRHGLQPVWVEADARFRYDGGQRLDIVLSPLDRPSADTPAPDEADEADEASHTGPSEMGDKADADPSDRVDPTHADGAPEADADPSDRADPTQADGAPEADADPWDRVDPTQADGAPEADEPGHVADSPAADKSTPADAGDGRVAATVMATLEAACATALWIDARGFVVSATPATGRALDCEVADLRGRPLFEVIELPEPAREALAVAIDGRMRQTVLAGGTDSEPSLVIEWVPGRTRGDGFVVVTTPTPTVNLGETERIRFQAQLVSHVSHDLRGAMSAVFSGLQLVADGLSDDDGLHDIVAQALADSRRANRIIDEVLAVSRPGIRKRVEVDLGRLIEGVIAHNRARADAASVEVRKALEPDLRLSGDPSAIERAFGNLIENALIAMADGGTLTLTAYPESRSEPGAHITVADTGTGIAPELQPNAFEPFVTDREEGTGLGLAITRRVVLEHGGQIDFESEPGAGTTFHVWLPCTS